MPTSMLSGHAIRFLRRQQRDLFQTGFSLADPPVSLVLSRYNVTTQVWDALDPQDVLVRWRHDKKLIRVYGEMSTTLASSPTPLDGMFLAFDPFDIATGDRFTFQNLSGRVNTVWPVRNGKRRASFTVESDKRTI